MSNRHKLLKLELAYHRKDINNARKNLHSLRFIAENLPCETDSAVSEIEACNCEYHLRNAADSAAFCTEIAGTTRRRKAVGGILKNRLIRLQRDVNGARLP